MLFCFSQFCFSTTRDKKPGINLVFIGDSITYGAKLDDPLQDAPPVKTSNFLQKQLGIGTVRFANCGFSGCTTMDFLPEQGILFSSVQRAADCFYKDRSTVLVFSILLGANDSANPGIDGSGITPERHCRNIKQIINRLLELYPGCRVVVHRPLWYSPYAYDEGQYLKGGLIRLNAYFTEIEKLIADYSVSFPGQVWEGDREGYNYFKKNYLTDLTPEEGSSGTFYLHPNKTGAAILGELWAKAIFPLIDSCS